MITDVTAATTTAAGAAAMKKATGMNKDDFLKLFVAQLQHQDPLNPRDGAEFVAQLAQLSQVEQAYNMNTNLQQMMNLQRDASALSAVSFIGKQALVPGNRIDLAAGAKPVLHFQLSEPTQQLKVDIKNAAGTTVKVLTLGPQPAGEGSIAWDGTDTAGKAQPAGTYRFSLAGIGAGGKSVIGAPLFEGRVDAVNLDEGTVLSVAGENIPLANVLRVRGVM